MPATIDMQLIQNITKAARLDRIYAPLCRDQLVEVSA